MFKNLLPFLSFSLVFSSFACTDSRVKTDESIPQSDAETPADAGGDRPINIGVEVDTPLALDGATDFQQSTIARDGALADESPAACEKTTIPLMADLPKSFGVLWSADVPSKAIKGELALAGAQIVVSAGTSLFFYNHDGTLGSRFDTRRLTVTSPATVGPDGAIYAAGPWAFRLKSNGDYVWEFSLVPSSTPDNEPLVANPPILSPNGKLFSVQPATGILQALDAATGNPIWQRDLTTQPGLGTAWLVGGVGSLVVANSTGGGFYVLRSEDGTIAWQGADSASESGSGLGATALVPGLGIVAGNYRSDPNSVDLWGWDGKRRWSFNAADQTVPSPVLVDQDGSLVFIEAHLPRGSGDRLVVRNCDGTISRDVSIGSPPESYFVAFSRGANGMTYGFEAQDFYNGARVVAWDANYKQIGEVDFPSEGFSDSGNNSLTIGDDGVLYLATQEVNGAGHLHAIQTSSPGLAKTALSSSRKDSLGTGWTAGSP